MMFTRSLTLDLDLIMILEFPRKMTTSLDRLKLPVTSCVSIFSRSLILIILCDRQKRTTFIFSLLCSSILITMNLSRNFPLIFNIRLIKVDFLFSVVHPIFINMCAFNLFIQKRKIAILLIEPS